MPRRGPKGEKRPADVIRKRDKKRAPMGITEHEFLELTKQPQ